MKFYSFSKLFGKGWRAKNNSKRSAKSAATNRVNLRLEELEQRIAPSVTPILPSALVSNQGLAGLGSGYNPQVVIDPLNSQKMVEVHSNGGGLAGNYTTDGGQTWSSFGLGAKIADPNIDQNPAAGGPVLFAATSGPGISFDRTEMFYVIATEHDAANTSGAVVIKKFNFAGLSPTTVSLTPPPGQGTGDLGGNGVLYRWLNQDPAYNPIVLSDTNPTTFKDPQTGAIQTDSMAATRVDANFGTVPKAVYVAWNTNFTQPSGSAVSPVSRIIEEASEDGGHSFSTTLKGLGNGSDLQMLITQETADQQLAGGRVSYFWNSGGANGPGTAVVMKQFAPDGGNAATPVTATQDFAFNPNKTIADGQPNPTSGQPDLTGITTDSQTITINAGDLTTINDLDVTINLIHPTLAELDISLTGPGGISVQLLRNGTDNSGNSTGNGISGANLGELHRGTSPTDSFNQAGTTFDSEADRSITDATAGAEWVGHYRPEAGSLTAAVNGKTAAQLSGTWTLTIGDHRNSGTTPPFQRLFNWSLHFTGLLSLPAGAATTVVRGGRTTSTVPGSANNTYSTTNPAAPTTGVGPGIVVAQDKTFGSYSQFQGRIYVAYTGGSGSNTDVYLTSSDDNGTTWATPTKLNDDTPSDNFSEGNREQFTPSIAVDPTTGELVISYYDARNDAALARVNTSITTSIDGGADFSPVTYANKLKTATDFLTGNQVTLEAIPGNQAQAGANGFGDREGLVVYGGNIFPIFSTNDNAAGESIRTAKMVTAAGPRVIFGDMGSVTQDFTDPNGVLTYNNTFASDGTRQLDGFVVQFDRPVDISTFTANQVTVQYQDPNTGAVSTIPLDLIQPIEALDAGGEFGFGFGPRGVGTDGTLASEFKINFKNAQSRVGTYSYAIGPGIQDKIRTPVQDVTALAPLSPFNSTDTPISFDPFFNPAPITSSLFVGSVPAGEVIDKVTVKVNVTDVFTISDLTLTLTAPDGTQILLFDQEGDGTSTNLNDTVFDDSAATPISAGSGDFSGSFQPEGPLALKGKNANGTWQLKVDDNGFGDTGSLNSWSITITPGTPKTTSTAGNFMDQNANAVANEKTIGHASTLINEPNGNGGFGGIGATDKTMRVLSNAGFPTVPSVGPFVVQIDQEQILVTRNSGLTWTIVRGVNGTQAVAHSDQSLITMVNAPDFFSIPTPNSINGVANIDGVPFTAPYQGTTLPLIIPGPHVVSSAVEGNPVTSDNLVLNNTVSTLDLTFDRLINPATFTVASIASIIGPVGPLAIGGSTINQPGGIGSADTTVTVVSGLSLPNTPFFATIDGEQVQVTSVNGNTLTIARGQNGTSPASHANGASIVPVTVTAIDPNTLQPTSSPTTTFRIGFPTQTLSGSYNIVVKPDMTDTSAQANKVDTNLNAGLDALRGNTDPNNATVVRPVYSAALGTTTINQLGGITAAATTVTVASSLSFPSAPFVVQIGAEEILVTNSSTNTWTIQRAYNGTTAAGHPNGASVAQVQVIPAHSTFTSTISIADAFSIFQSTSRSIFDGLTQTTLTSNVATIDTSINVASNFGFSSAPFVIQIGTEQMLVTGMTGTNWSVERGFNNTAVATHKSGDAILLGTPATIELELNILHKNIPDLSATLTAPDGQVINLFPAGLTFGQPSHANFTNTVFDDAATTPIQQAGAPINAGPFNPQTPLSVENGSPSKGSWVLTITNSGAFTGTLTHWEMRLPHTVPSSGLGEPNADRFSESFRIFTQATTNAQSYLQWTPVGPAANNSGANSGRIGGLAVDPSDPSGNTVYVAGASGGIWKTTNFLTNDANGPTYVPLTDLGPTYSLNIGSLAVFGRNNDPNQTVIFAATGEGDVGSSGVGFLRSMDGGRTWQVLDSTTNVDNNGVVLPMAAAARDHLFVGATSFKVAVDPTPLVNGQIAVYAALSGSAAQGGLWRSIDSGNTWFRVKTGNATDVALAAASRDNNGNISVMYGAFRGDGVYITHNALTATSMTQMTGGQISTPRVDDDQAAQPEIPTVAPASTPNGGKGRIVLATPALSNNPLADDFYQGWVYAAVVTTAGTLDGVYLTKDFGLNWTKLNLPTYQPTPTTAYGTNNETRTSYNPLGGTKFAQGNYDISFAIDPNNPNITYLGGSADGTPLPASGMIRIDATKVDDPYILSAYANNEADGGTTQFASTGPTSIPPASMIHRGPGQPYGILNPNNPGSAPQSGFLNLYREPTNPFVNPSTLHFTNVLQFNNSGTDVRWMDFNNALDGSTDQHELLAITDPLTGGTRLIFGDDQGVFTGVDRGDGTLTQSVGVDQVPTGSRNGNLQITQFYYGASQPSTLAAQLAGALFYGEAQDNGAPASAKDILTSGNLNWTGPQGDGTGIATDQTGSGTVYQYNWPCCNGAEGSGGGVFGPTDFFLVTSPGQGTTSRTSGLVQPGDDPGNNVGQWPFTGGSNFAVNPVDPTGIVMSSQAGRIFLTSGPTLGTGKQWHVIGEPGDLDSTYAPAVAFGAPASSGVGSLDDFIYAGTSGGKIFVTFTGGGYNGSTNWRDISTGLDGSAVQQIVTNPKRGTHEAYAVTRNGVYWMQDSSAASPSWVKLNDLTTLATTTIKETGGIGANDTTMTVNSSVGFKGTPFIVKIDNELIKVTNVNGTTWTIQRAVNMTTRAPHANGATITEVDPLFTLNRGVFNNPNDPFPTLKYLTTIQADWRLAIPDIWTTINQPNGLSASATSMTVTSGVGFPTAPFTIQIDAEQIQVTATSANTWTLVRGVNGTIATAHTNGTVISIANGTTHPVLYVAGEGGVFRSTDKGVTWTYYPDVADDGASQDGGYIPDAHITELSLVLGNVNPSTGFSDPSTGFNLLLATTYGRGDFAIRIDNSANSQFIVAPNSGPKVTNASTITSNFGTTLAGFDVTFGSAVDPATFTTPPDVVVTGPNGPVAVQSVTDISGTSLHNVYEIDFTTAQGTNGNYTLTIGPDVRDFSGNEMDQDNDNVNGGADDVYSNTFSFTANTPPTISGLPTSTVYVAPGTSTLPIGFTVGDKETPAGSLQVSAQFTPDANFTGAAPQWTFGGSGANRTITVSAADPSHGTGTITVTVTDGGGLQTSGSFALGVDKTPILPAITPNPYIVNHGSQTPTTINLSAVDPNAGDSLTYSVTLHDPLYDLKILYGLDTPEITSLFGYSGGQEKFFHSSNGSNNTPTGGGLYIITPDGKLRAWNGMLGWSGSTIVADVSTSVYANPALLYTNNGTPVVSGTNPLYDAMVQYGLNTPEMTGLFGLTGENERFFHSSNGSNNTPSGGGLYLLLGDGTLRQWNGAFASSSPVVANLGAAGISAYANPALLYNAMLPVVTGVTASTSNDPKPPFPPPPAGSGSVTITPLPAFERSVIVTVKATDGLLQSVSQSFTYTVHNTAPTLTSISGPPSVIHGQSPGPITLNVGDAEDPIAALSYKITVVNQDPLYDLKVKYGLDTPDIPGLFNHSGGQEKFLHSSNGSNNTVAGGGLYLLTPDGNLRAWDGSSWSTSPIVPDPAPGTAAYANPALIYNATQPVPTTAEVNRGQLYDLREQFGLNTAEVTGLFNLSGSAEKFLHSTNGSNNTAMGGGLYLLMQDGSLRQWNGVSATSSPVVGTAGTDAYANPSLLTTSLPALVGDSINAFKVQFGLDTADIPGLFNHSGGNEKFLHSSNGSNNTPAGGGLYVLYPLDNTLRQWNGVSAATSTVVGNITAAVYANPALLYASTGRISAVNASVDTSGNLTLTPNTAFVGTARVTVTASDGAENSPNQNFLFTATNTAPTASPSPTSFSTGAGTGTVNLNSNGNDAGETLQYSTPVVLGYDPLYDLKVKYGLNTPDIPSLFGYSHHQEKFLHSSNESNAAIPSHGGLYVLLPNGDLREWNGVDATTGTFIANVGASVYNNPALLYNASQPAAPSGVTVSRTGDTLNLVWPSGFMGTFRVSITIGDGANEILETFLVTVGP
jgi:subtilisin-like proprotein convertase family protein